MQNQSKGILFLLLSTFFFSIMAITVKSIPEVPIAEKMFFRNIFGMIIAAIMAWKNRENFIGNHIKLLLGRSLFGTLGVAAYYYSISFLPLSDAVILNKMSPFFLMLLAFIFLGEKIDKLQISACIIALEGAFFVIKPQLDYSVFPSIVAVSSAVFAASAYIFIKMLRSTYASSVIVFHFCLFSTLATLPFLLSGKFIMPNMHQTAMLCIIGLAATIAQFFMTHAYKYAPASQLTIYNYADIIFSTILGIMIWSEIPDILTITGGLLIVLGGVINYYGSVYLTNVSSCVKPLDSNYEDL